MTHTAACNAATPISEDAVEAMSAQIAKRLPKFAD